MASLKEATTLTDDLEKLVGELRDEIEGGSVDFQKIVSIADEISEHADGIAETFSNVNETLMERLGQLKNGSRSRSSSSSGSKSSAKSGSRG
jgi:hypothetical protein